MNFIGVLSLFKICSRIFRLFHLSGDFSHAEVLKGVKIRVGLRRDFFKMPLKWSEKLVLFNLAVFEMNFFSGASI